MVRTTRAFLIPFFAFGLALGACSSDSTDGEDGDPPAKDAGSSGTLDGGTTTTPDSGTTTCTCNVTPSCDLNCNCDPDCNTVPDSGTTGTPDSGTGTPDSGTVRPDTGPYDGGVPNTDPFDPGARASELATASCNRTSTCEPAQFDFAQTDLATCITETTQAITPIYNAYNQGITAGRVGFNATAFSACITALGSADCDLGINSGVCDTQVIFTGSQAAGQPCSVLAECSSGNFCALQQLGSCATCEPYALPGQSCAMALCASGSDCFQVDQAGTVLCVSTQAGEGQPCGTVQDGVCRGLLQCAGTDPTFTCQRLASSGQACDPDPMGTAGPFCNIYENVNCNSATSMCETVTWNGAGSACDGELQLCNGNTNGCNTGTMTCDALPTAGQTCVMGACADNHYCDQAGTCQTLKAQGSPCGASAECDGAYLCVGGVCQDFPYTSCN